MANTEQIEAKLCAYVDGELDAAGRAEIEQHLAAHPQHRALLAELMEQRELLRDLPRESAPEELTEALQAHLERSVLLGSSQGPQVAGKINHRPQFLALAAVLLLAIGLVAVILMVLPDQSKQIHNYAVLPTTTTAPSGTLTRVTGDFSLMPTTAVADDTTSASGILKSEDKARLVTSAAAPAAPGAPADLLKSTELALNSPPAPASPTTQTTLAFAGKGSSTADGGDVFSTTNGIDRAKDTSLTSNAGKVFDQPPLSDDIQKRVTQSPQVAANSVVLVVASNDPSATDRELTGYLAQNKIHWDEVTEPMPKPVSVNRATAYQSKLQAPMMKMRDAITPVAAEAAPVAPAAKREAAKTDNEAVRGSITGADQIEQKAAAPAAQPQSVATATQSTDQVAQQIQAQEKGVPTTDTAGQQQIAQQSQFGQQVIATVARPSRYIVARGLTQQQIVDLNGCLNVQNNGRIANYRRSGSEILPTTIPFGATLQTSFASTSPSQFAMQTATPVASPRLEPPGAFGGGGSGTRKQLDDGKVKEQPTTQPTGASAATQPVDGLIAGAAAAKAPTRLPTVTVAAGSQPVAANAVAALAPPATQASTQATMQLATTAPAVAIQISPTTNPSEERLDVVIVVKPDPSAQINETAAIPAAPGAAPTTAPATTQPAVAPSAPQEKAVAK